MAKLVILSAAEKGIRGAKKISTMTNEKYRDTSKKADEMIEQNNRAYATMYKRASQYFAR